MIRLCLLALAVGAAPPPPLDPLLADLASDDFATWRGAADALWHAGDAAIPALRRLTKGGDPDVILRARLVLSKLEWGIRPETPPAVLALIERYRDGDLNDKQVAIAALAKLGGVGYSAITLLMRKVSVPAEKVALANQLKLLTRPAARDHIARGEWDRARQILEAAAASGGEESLRDLAAFLTLTGRPAPAGAPAALTAYLHRTAGDLGAAITAAEKLEDKVILAGLLREAERFPELAKVAPWVAKTHQARAALLHRAGDRAGCEAALAALPDDQYWARAGALFFNGRPREGIAALSKTTSRSAAVTLLTLQGRYREALAVPPPDHFEQRIFFNHELSITAHLMGDEDRAAELRNTDAGIAFAIERAGTTPFNFSILGSRLEAGRRTGKRAQALAEVGKVLDKLRPATIEYGYGLWEEVSAGDHQSLALWWHFLRAPNPDAQPSETFRMLDAWFHDGKADKDFDATLKNAEAWPAPGGRQAAWRTALMRACLKVGRGRRRSVC